MLITQVNLLQNDKVQLSQIWDTLQNRKQYTSMYIRRREEVRETSPMQFSVTLIMWFLHKNVRYNSKNINFKSVRYYMALYISLF